MKKSLLCVLLCCGVARAQPIAPEKPQQTLTKEAAWFEAIWKDDIAMARELIARPDYDPLLWLPQVHRDNALGYALHLGRNEIAIAMMQAAPIDAYLSDIRVFSSLSERHSLPALRALMANPRFDPNVRSQGIPLLVNLALEGNSEGMQLLLDHPKIDATARDKDNGATALMVAAWSRFPRTVALILADKRIDPNAVADDYDGDTALHRAARNVRSSAITLLLADERTDANILNKAGQSPLDVAIERGWPAVAPFLEWEKVGVSPAQKAQIAAIRPAARE